MTSIKTSVILLFCAFIFVLSNCKKKESKVVEDAPVVKAPLLQADTEIRTSVEVTFANRVVSDFILMAGFISENSPSVFFTDAYSTSSTSTSSFLKDSLAKTINVSFNQSKCIDGLFRDGSVLFNYQSDPPAYPNNALGAKYFHQFGFGCKLTLNQFKVGEYQVSNTDVNSPAIIYNNLSTAQPDFETTKMSWKIKGKFTFTHLIDPSKNMTWEGELIMILDNSNASNIFIADKQNIINWPNAKLSMKGLASGQVSGNVTYNSAIDNLHALKKDLACAIPNPYTISPPKKSGLYSFIDGLMTISVSSSTKTRSVFYGNIDFSMPFLCNNSGIIYVENTNLPIEFK